MKILSLLPVLALSLTACTNQTATAQQADTIDATAVAVPANTLTVAELFTSQGCSSCPPAERIFSKLADKDDLLTIEWHVDYWDRLVHHGSRWKDPYSNPDFTERQRAYNRSLRGRSGAYTPQAVVNGHFEGVGNRRAEVNDMLDSAPALSVPVSIANNKALTVGPSSEGEEIVFLRLLKRHETDVKGGENKGKELSGRNIVLEATVIGTTGSAPTELTLPAIKDGETCAVLIQSIDDNLGPIMGAAKCT